MFKIGAFSRLSMVSIRMLRHYHDIGLLSPQHIDPETGYRYYTTDQLSRVYRIQSLKAMGFSLSAIADILTTYQDKEQLRHYLEVHLTQVHQQSAELEEQKKQIQSAIERLREDDNPMNYSVTLKEIPEMQVIYLRDVIPSYNEESILWQKLGKQMEGKTFTFAEPQLSVAVFYDEGYKEEDVDVEIRIPVVGEYQDLGKVQMKTVPKTLVASALLKGSYDQLLSVSEAIGKWIGENGYEIDGPMFDIYHVSPACDPNPENWVTEICFPVKKK